MKVVLSVLNIVLVEPEIPQNCGNIARTCARPVRVCISSSRSVSTSPTAPSSARAGLLASGRGQRVRKPRRPFCNSIPRPPRTAGSPRPRRRRTTARRNSRRLLALLRQGDRGLPRPFRVAHYERCIRLPMRAEARSLNLSNSVAILTYEALKQHGFPVSRHRREWRSNRDHSLSVKSCHIEGAST